MMDNAFGSGLGRAVTSTLVQEPDPAQRARDWVEIQERMLVPLYETVYDRLRVGAGTRLLELGCGSGLALLLAAARGASVTGTDSDMKRLGLARERLLPSSAEAGRHWDAELAPYASCGSTLVQSARPDVVTAFDAPGHIAELAHTAPALVSGTPVALASWGPPDRCGVSSVLQSTTRTPFPVEAAGGSDADEPTVEWQGETYVDSAPVDSSSDRVNRADLPSDSGTNNRQRLAELAHRCGLRPFQWGSVACSFGYADLDSAVRGLLSTGLFDAPADDDGGTAAEGDLRTPEELALALAPHQRADGTVWMPHLFQYLLTRA